jgi:malic enzyme
VPTFNDDIQATAAVAVAAVLGGVQVPGVLPLTQQRWLFFGAGQVSSLCVNFKLHKFVCSGLLNPDVLNINTPKRISEAPWWLFKKDDDT